MNPLRTGALLVTAGTLAACGGQLSDAQVRAANLRTLAPAAQTGAEIPTAASGTTTAPDPAGPAPVVTAGPTSAATGPVAAPTVGGPAPVTSAAGRPTGKATTSPRAGKATSTSAAPGVGTPGQTGPIVIGSVGNYSGAPGAALSGLPRGLQVWAAAINNSGGLFGRQVQVIVEDDGGDPSTYGSDVQDLVENKHVVAFVDQGALLTYQGGSDYLTSHGIPIIGSDCSRTDNFSHPNLFQQCQHSDDYGRVLFKIVKKITGATKAGYLNCLESATCTEEVKPFDDYAKAAGMTIVYKGSASITTIDFTSYCQAAQQAGAEVFFVAADPTSLARFAQSCDRQGYKPQYFGAAIGVLSTSNQVDGLEGLLLGSYVFPFAGVSGNPAIDEYTAAMAKYDKNEPPGPASSQGWAGAKLFQLAATRAAATAHTITPKSLTDALKTIKGETLGGLTVPLNFTTYPATPAPCAFTIKSDPATKRWGAPSGDDLLCL